MRGILSCIISANPLAWSRSTLTYTPSTEYLYSGYVRRYDRQLASLCASSERDEFRVKSLRFSETKQNLMTTDGPEKETDRRDVPISPSVKHATLIRENARKPCLLFLLRFSTFLSPFSFRFLPIFFIFLSSLLFYFAVPFLVASNLISQVIFHVGIQHSVALM